MPNVSRSLAEPRRRPRIVAGPAPSAFGLWMLICLIAAVAANGVELRTYDFYSPAVDRELSFNIALPDGYESSDERYPVIYLLHGMLSDYRSWWQEEGVGFYADAFGEVIVVMPDGGNFWYVDWPETASDSASDRWEAYIVEDLIPHIDSHFRTLARRQARAIAGHSMGGFGAFAIGLRHSELFVSIGSSSGQLDYARGIAKELEREAASEKPTRKIRRRQRVHVPNRGVFGDELPPGIGNSSFDSRPERTPQGRPFESIEEALAHDPFTLVEQIAKSELPHIYFDCGTEDSLFPFSREMAKKLLDLRIPFDFHQSPGFHDDPYRDRAVGRLLSAQVEAIERALGRRPSHEPAGTSAATPMATSEESP